MTIQFKGEAETVQYYEERVKGVMESSQEKFKEYETKQTLLCNEIINVQSELDEIKSSPAWKLIQILRKKIDTYFLFGTKRRKILDAYVSKLITQNQIKPENKVKNS